ncbi:ABC transporter permease [Polynucleobacter sp. HIN6]|uniref:ABC transporter permease n=1 Tax=Polynucleobacter sp. HIN6 TaxID=3047865 RepID=UPI002572F0D9|nr:ABC transporter permease [Polynucleobacter sp. HIN6]
MQNFSCSPREMIASIWRNRSLVIALTKREVIGRYRGSMLGILWSFFNPVFMLVVYTFVFSVVFKARWSGGGDSKTEFALILFSGLIVFSLFAECINRAPSLILANVNYVKKVVFPLEILPLVALLASLFHFMVSLIVWLIFYLIFFGKPQHSIIFLPLVILPLIFLTVGLSWVLASLGVYLRDISQIVGVLTTALMFLSPIFYPISALPLEFQTSMHLNPLTLVIESTREVLVRGHIPSLKLWTIQLAVSIMLAWLGFAWFQRTRKGFADVL